MNTTTRAVLAGVFGALVGLAGCAPGPMEFATRGTYFEPPPGCVLRKAKARNTVSCALPGSATHDRLFAVQTTFDDVTDAQRAGHAQDGSAYWIAILEEKHRREARQKGRVTAERYDAVDPVPRNATACLRAAITLENASAYGDVRGLECLYYDAGAGQVVSTRLEYTEGRGAPGPATASFEADAQAALSTLRFTEPPVRS